MPIESSIMSEFSAASHFGKPVRANFQTLVVEVPSGSGMLADHSLVARWSANIQTSNVSLRT
jgi:hypothetical protein